MESDLTHTKLFFLASDLVTDQLALLACALPRERFAPTVGVLGPSTGPAADALRAAGVEVLALPVRGPLDFSGMRRLRGAIRTANPAVLHGFGPAAVRAARLAVSGRADGHNDPPLVVSGATELSGGFGGWLTTRQLRRADRVIATGRGEGERYRALGVRGERLSRIGPAVAPPPGTARAGRLLPRHRRNPRREADFRRRPPGRGPRREGSRHRVRHAAVRVSVAAAGADR